MNDENNQSLEKETSAPKQNFPPWLKKIGKLMVFFVILGCIFMTLGALLLNSVIDNALSGHGL